MDAITLAQTSHGTASARDKVLGVLIPDIAVIVLIARLLAKALEEVLTRIH
jgi:hypothetical protein